MECGILVYSIDNESSFNNLHTWLDVMRSANPYMMIVLVGNKADFTDKRVVSKDQAEDFKNQNNLFIAFETSAWTDIESIRELFACIGKEIVKRGAYDSQALEYVPSEV